MIGHEVRSPAGVAWSALTELQEALAGDPTHHPMILIARRSVRRLLRLSERLSMTADLEQGPLALQLAPVALRELVVRMGEEAYELIARKGVVLEIEPTEPNQTSIQADARWLGPVIMELIGNALRHARARVRVRATVDDANATILIEDDGRGFPEGFVVAGRERFVAEGAVGGVGFSLCMASDVATAHGGRIFGGKSTLPPQSEGVVGAAVSVEIPTQRRP